MWAEATGLLRLGSVFMASGVMSAGVLFVLRALLVRAEGAAGAGQFQAGTALSMVYVGFILQAMGTDFFRRLTAAASDKVLSDKLLNEQSEVALVLALPGVPGAIAFAPWIVRLLYTNQFDQATEISLLADERQLPAGGFVAGGEHSCLLRAEARCLS